mgnify:CR=1 FL=1
MEINPAINSLWDSINDLDVISTAALEALILIYFPLSLITGFLAYKAYGRNLKGISITIFDVILILVYPLLMYLILHAIAKPCATFLGKVIVLVVLYYLFVYSGWGLLHFMRSITDKMYIDSQLRNAGRQMYLGEKTEKWASNPHRTWDDE